MKGGVRKSRFVRFCAFVKEKHYLAEMAMEMGVAYITRFSMFFNVL